jgi:hypothetical protein
MKLNIDRNKRNNISIFLINKNKKIPKKLKKKQLLKNKIKFK